MLQVFSNIQMNRYQRKSDYQRETRKYIKVTGVTLFRSPEGRIALGPSLCVVCCVLPINN